MRNILQKYRFIFFLVICFFQNGLLQAQSEKNDTLRDDFLLRERYESFYDTLKYRAEQRKLTRWLHKLLIAEPKPVTDKKALSINYYSEMAGKTIRRINIQPLEVFGPSLQDTTRKATSWLERSANWLHTKSNLNNIRRNLLFHEGESVDPELLYENERILRSLPYIRDVRIILVPDSLNGELVTVHLLTQDRFSIGVSGNLNGVESAALEVYDRNILGIGHEVSARFVGHVNKEPYSGIEAFYKINNLSGKFLSFMTGYTNTYQKEGFLLQIQKDLLLTTTLWGYGISATRFYRTNRVHDALPLESPDPLDFSRVGCWLGRNFQLSAGQSSNSQLTLSAMFEHRSFNQRPLPQPPGEQYYYNTNLWLGGITWSQRNFIRDQLVYSYGITEDIPRGFKNELALGIDQAEMGRRWYGHLYLSNGNLIRNKPGYLFASAGVSGYLRNHTIEQGLVELQSSYISRLFVSGKARFRQFVQVNYKWGINRFELENLQFERNNLIRGFNSDEVSGKQRLSLNVETVYFQKRDFYKFNLAFFTFIDLGIIGSEKKLIFNENYYGGLGVGLRVHNESLVLQTLQLRLAFYPNHPSDVGLLGFILSERTRQSFYSFQPGPPRPRLFN